jgi:Nucleotidyltransferase domain
VHIYAFGSICRGDIGQGSDIDLLALVNTFDRRFDPEMFSIYSYNRIGELWDDGNPFAWHLHIESRLLFASDQQDYFDSLGAPGEYVACVRDCEKFRSVFTEAADALKSIETSKVFGLSTMFLGVRNIATCFSLGTTTHPTFSRHSAKELGENSIQIPAEAYAIMERARILATRAKGQNISADEVRIVLKFVDDIGRWMERLIAIARKNERISK